MTVSGRKRPISGKWLSTPCIDPNRPRPANDFPGTLGERRHGGEANASDAANSGHPAATTPDARATTLPCAPTPATRAPLAAIEGPPAQPAPRYPRPQDTAIAQHPQVCASCLFERCTVRLAPATPCGKSRASSRVSKRPRMTRGGASGGRVLQAQRQRPARTATGTRRACRISS
jgi:hypothetical protein